MLCTGNRTLRVDLGKYIPTALTIFPSSWWFCASTLLTLSTDLNVKKANPLDRPVGSRMMVQLSISPNWIKYARSPSRVKPAHPSY